MNNNNKAFSSIIALLMIWFLLILTVWTFNLVLKELFDNKSLWNYVKAYAGAQWAAELALLTIKEKWYWYSDKIEHTINNKSIVISNNPLNISNFNKVKDTFISYNLNTKSSLYKWNLNSLWYDIIPLFYLTWNNNIIVKKVSAIKLNITAWIASDISWNIISDTTWISWVWEINTLTLWKWRQWINFIEKNVNNFLANNINKTNYILLFNAWNNNIKYDINTINTWEFLSKPKTEIITSGEVWWYKQNIRITLDNTKYLNILKYSIYWN